MVDFCPMCKSDASFSSRISGIGIRIKCSICGCDVELIIHNSGKTKKLDGGDYANSIDAKKRMV